MVDVYIFLGPPGSGKGTLSNLCANRLGWLQFSTGNVCREHIEKRTEIGKQIDFILKSGKLISDSVIVDIVTKWLEERLRDSNTIILDGFPRTLVQAQELMKILEKPEFSDVRLHIIRLVVVDEIVINRLSTRVICKNNACAAVYSLSKDSPVKLVNQGKCNICSSELIKRIDDEVNAIKNRLKIYYQHEREILKFYKDIGQTIDNLDVDASIENVYNLLHNLQ